MSLPEPWNDYILLVAEKENLLMGMGDVSQILKDKPVRIVPVNEETKTGRLYLPNRLLAQERTNYAVTPIPGSIQRTWLMFQFHQNLKIHYY